MEHRYADAKAAGRSISSVQSTLFDRDLHSIVSRRRHGDSRPAFLPFTACCCPGTKLAVDADGRFQVCERVNGTQPIGNVSSGLDYERIAALLADYNRSVCTSCWACPVTKLCQECLATCERNGGFGRTPTECTKFRDVVSKKLGTVYSIRERQPAAFVGATAEPLETLWL